MRCLPTICLLLVSSVASAEPKSVTEKFEGDERPKAWTVNFGHWEPEGGELIAKQLSKDNHAAASRWRMPLTDAKIRLRLDLGSAKAFHLGFDPARGTLKKKGHLYSLILSPGKATITKHKDKNDEKSKNENLAEAVIDPPPQGWVDVELTTEGNTVTAKVGKSLTLTATDPSFHVAKPGVVFRVVGETVKIDDVEITILK